MKRVYSDALLPQVPRLLSCMDRNPESPTYGCLDRAYWYYKVSDFPNARFQEGALTLALLYSNAYPESPYCDKDKVAKLAKAAVSFLAKVQHNDGSFDEYYPSEHSFVATAFPLYACSEALLTLKKSCVGIEKIDSLVASLRKAGEWLVRHEDLAVVNHQLGAVAALQSLFELSEDEKYAQSAEKKLSSCRERRSDEGWFSEYGGADIGYTTLAIDYLAKYYLKTESPEALEFMDGACEFLSHFIHPNGTLGGEYGSRNTEYFIPHGLEVLSRTNEKAGWITSYYIAALSEGTAFQPQLLDDRFLIFNGYTFLQAYDDFSEKTGSWSPEPVERTFTDAGLYVKRDKEFYFVSGLKKGGVFKIFNSDGPVYSDSGFAGALESGKKITSQWLDQDTTFTWDGGTLKVNGVFHAYGYQTLSPAKNLAVRSFLYLFGGPGSDFLKGYLRKRFITKSATVPVTFERRIEFKESIVVDDTIRSSLKIDCLRAYDHLQLIFVPSSRFFQMQELETKQELTPNLAGFLNASGEVSVRRVIEPKTGKVEISVM